MNQENALVSKAVQSGQIEKLVALGIEDRHFNETDSKEVWLFLTKHLSEYGVPPSYEIVKNEFPDYEFNSVTDSTEYIKDKFLAYTKRREAIEAIRDLTTIIDSNNYEDMSKIEEIFLDKARDLSQLVPSGKVARYSDMKNRIAEYKRKKDLGIPPGILFGVPSLDEMTLGVQPHEYVTLAGSTGVGKSTLLLFFAMNHYIDGHTPMIVSLEMSDEEIFRKLDAMAAGLKQQALKAMELDHKSLERWENQAERAEEAAQNIIVVDIDEATPERIYAEASRWKPDILGVDYIQLLDAPKYLRQQHERVGHVSKSMKQLARQLKIPVYGLAQTNSEGFDEGAKLSNLGQSRDIGRHSDIVLGLAQDEEDKAQNKIELRLLKARGGPVGNVNLLWDHANSIYREWRLSDLVPVRERTESV